MWLEQRRGRFTSSEIWKLMTDPKSKSAEFSETALTYIYEKVGERLTGYDSGHFDNEATTWGHTQEPNARMWYTRLQNVEVEETGFVEYDEFLGGSPDGLVGEDGLIEIKCPFKSSVHISHVLIKDEPDFKKEFKNHYWQVKCNILVTGRKWCDFVSYDPRLNHDKGLFVFRVYLIDEEKAEILSRVEKASKKLVELINQIADETN